MGETPIAQRLPFSQKERLAPREKTALAPRRGERLKNTVFSYQIVDLFAPSLQGKGLGLGSVELTLIKCGTFSCNVIVSTNNVAGVPRRFRYLKLVRLLLTMFLAQLALLNAFDTRLLVPVSGSILQHKQLERSPEFALLV
jgi:hypothetical protein